MIVFSALVPHPPFLVPNIGRDASEKLHATRAAYEQVMEHLTASKPDTIVMISPHAPRYPDAWSANMSPTFTAHMQEFGDHETTVKTSVNYLLIDRLHRALREKKMPFTLRTSETLDFGYTVPLFFLTQHLTAWNLVPLAPNEQGLQEQAAFGAELYRTLQSEEARIALFASADLCHHVHPGGATSEHPETRAFDEAARTAARTKSIDPLIQASIALPEDKHACGERSIAILLGALKELNTTYEEHCYEAPFGVGYLTASYRVA